MKRLCSSLLAVLLVSLLSLPALAAETALPKVREYPGFADVVNGVWYEEAVKLCYEAGVMNGSSDTAFSPQDPLTLAQLEVLAARVHWRLQGGTGDPPAAPAGTGSVSIKLSNGDLYPVDSAFLRSNWTGLGGRELPQGDFIVTLLGEKLNEVNYPSIQVTVDGSKTFRGTFDRQNSFDPLFIMYRIHVTEEDFSAWDPCCKLATYAEARGDAVDAWYWGADLYLKSLPEAEPGDFQPELTKPATRQDAAKLLSLVSPAELLPALLHGAPPDTQDPDVLRLYQAGVITGVDDTGSFNGKGALTRAQFAVLLARLIQPDLRQVSTNS